MWLGKGDEGEEMKGEGKGEERERQEKEKRRGEEVKGRWNGRMGR